MSNKLPIRLRAANEEDVPFIFNSWLKSYRSSHFAKFVSNTVYYNEHHKLIEKLAKENTVIVACNEKDPTQVYGWICGSHIDGFFVCHYVYVKHSFRNMGIGKELLNSFSHNPDTASIYTHHTRVCDRLAMKFNFVFHPYILFDCQEDSNDSKEN